MHLKKLIILQKYTSFIQGFILLKYKEEKQNQVPHKSTYTEKKNEYKKEFHAWVNIYASLFSFSTAIFWIHK